MDVIEPRYTQADLERAYRQGVRAGAQMMRARSQAALGAVGEAAVASADSYPIPNNLRATVARMAQVGTPPQVRQQPHVTPSPLARPFPGNGLAPTQVQPTTPPHEQVRQWPAALHSSPHHQGPRPDLTIIPYDPEEPGENPTRRYQLRPDLTLVQEEHGTKKLPRT